MAAALLERELGRLSSSSSSSSSPDSEDRSSSSSLEERVVETVRLVVEYGGRLGSSLQSLDRNTSPSFWWTTWCLQVVIGLFALALLVKVRNQLALANRQQALFQRMWAEEIRWRGREKKQYAYPYYNNNNNNNNNARRLYTRYNTRNTALADILDAVGPIPVVGTQAYWDFLEDLRDAMVYHGDEEDDEEEEDEDEY
ncbi:hypothetical protein F5Y17DRAFT_476308 [Xylariaceae sp. FL0594]|nr:hypothetical protein F5Y17DRAFT_476308 [Xylariaceae sp. FL0594]